MSRLITAKIDVTKIKKELLFVGTKGIYLNLIIWQNDNPDQFGNTFSIQQTTKQGDPKIYIGEGKFYVKKEPEAPVQEKTEDNIVPVPVPINAVLGPASKLDDLPF
jgi:hypothetical protein